MKTQTTKTIGPLNVDARAIGSGLYALIEEKGESAIVAFGMVPKWVIDALERELRAKIIRIAAEQIGDGCTPEGLQPYLDEDAIKEIMRPVVHTVTCEIYSAAARAGKMCV